jgi:hypothetical protein
LLITIVQQEAPLAACTPAEHQPGIVRRAWPNNRRNTGRDPV